VLLAVIIFAASWLISPGPWRAVFLTNNQVYFGKFSRLPFASTITLDNVYYLQVNQPLQSGGVQAQTQPPQFSVIKLGSEVHGPKGTMVIPLGQILFWEDLRNDSAVVHAIVSAQSK